MIRVLMVCMGNICRSPTAEAMLRRHVEDAGLADRIHIDSAGTHDYHVGDPPDRRAIAHGRKHGLAMEQLRGRQVSADDLRRFDYVLAMDRDNLDGLLRLARKVPKEDIKAHVGLLLDFATDRAEDEVPDPYYGGAEGFDHVISLVEAGCDGLLAVLKQRLAGGSTGA